MFTLKDRVNMHTSFTTHCSDDFGEHEDYDGGLAVAEQKPQLKKPSLYQVLLMNDDYTPMEFVVEVLETYFMKTREQATQIMLKVHTEGSAVCGVFPRDIAETKSAQVDEFSKVNQHPLKSIVQAAD